MSLRSDPLAYLTGQLIDQPQPPAITPYDGGGKFAPDGTVLPFLGNTFLCHIDPTSPAHAAMVQIQTELQAGPYAEAFTFLPPSSFHMTVFQGISTLDPAQDGWPQDVDDGQCRAEISEIMQARIKGVRFPRGHRVRATDLFAGHSFTVVGADDAEEASLRQVRKVLRDNLRMHPSDFDGYFFHVTLGYLLRWLSSAEAQSVIQQSNELFEKNADRLSDIELGPIEFCHFDDMHHFDIRHRI